VAALDDHAAAGCPAQGIVPDAIRRKMDLLELFGSETGGSEVFVAI
jgi:hypothetical protein